MPLYEEKLICPFAVRFSQERIKEVFQDGREVKEALAQIEARPGAGGYDLALHAPFPTIEVLRWTPRHGEACDGEHWFTLDNRRLYCLQRAAAAHWPKKVAAVVQVLYNDAGSMWRKYDSTTCGRSVSIGRCLEAIVDKWDWSAEVVRTKQDGGAVAETMHRTALAVVAADDRRATVDALADAPEEPGSLMAMLQRISVEAAATAPPPATGGVGETTPATAKPMSAAAGCPTPSTHDGSEDSDSSAARSAAERAAAAAAALGDRLCGAWEDVRGEGYVVQARGEGTWLARTRAAGGRRFILTYGKEDGLVWWGGAKTHFLDPADVVGGLEHVQWYADRDRAKRRSCFTWRRPKSESTPCASPGETGGEGEGQRESAAKGGRAARRGRRGRAKDRGKPSPECP